MSYNKPIILNDNEYCHVVNQDTGIIELVEGPRRFFLPANKSIYQRKKKKVVLKEGEYIILINPYDKEKKKCILGSKRIIHGPLTKSLYPDEMLKDNKKYRTRILTDNEGIVIMATHDYGKRKAGEKWIVKGPCQYFAHKYERVMKIVNAVQVSQNESIYVRNTLNSKLKKVEGPISYFPGVFEEIYEKKLSNDEYEALKISKRPSSKAFQIQVQKGEAVCVVDFKTNEEKYVIGPQGYQIGPHEGVKVLNCSARVPKVENAVKLAVVRLGPDFMQDKFSVRTRDNAVVQLLISYKWRFIVNDLEKYKIFQGDFVGYSCQSMRSRVREEVSKHEFEIFHTNSSQILRENLFKNYEIDIVQSGKKKSEKFTGRFFKEFNFLIFQLDVKQIKPVDIEIERLLNESIKSSMKIMCAKKQDQAEMENKKNEINSKVEIERMRTKLISIENQNYRKENVEKTKIDGQTRVETAKSAMQAELLIQQSRINLEINILKQKMDLLKGESGDTYIKYIKAKNFADAVTKMTVVPKDTKTLFLQSSSKKRSITYDSEEEED